MRYIIIYLHSYDGPSTLTLYCMISYTGLELMRSNGNNASFNIKW